MTRKRKKLRLLQTQQKIERKLHKIPAATMQTSSSVPLVSLLRMFDLIRESLAFLVWARRNNGLPASSQIVDHPCVNELLKRSPSSLWDLHWNSNTTSLWPTNVLTGDAMGEFMFRMFHNDKLFSPRLSWGTVTVTRPSPNGCKVNEQWGKNCSTLQFPSLREMNF